MTVADLAHELAVAEESARVLDLLGRAVVDWRLVDAWEAIAEDAAERAAIMAEASVRGFDGGGLVSLPTTCPERAAGRVAAASRSMREALDASGAPVVVRERGVRAMHRVRGCPAVAEKHRVRLARMRRSCGIAARAHEAASVQPGFRSDYCAMLTLTYRGGVEAWEPGHVRACLHRIRKWLARRHLEMRYVWVAELQRRGSVHYHVALWLPAGVVIPKADRRGWWPHGASRIEAAQSAPRYLMKYLSKGTDVSGLPEGAHMHGAGGLDHAARRAKRWLSMPAAVRARADIFDDWRAAPGGGWVHLATGEHLDAEYARAWLGDRWGPIKVRDHGRPFLAAGPFVWLHRRPEVQ